MAWRSAINSCMRGGTLVDGPGGCAGSKKLPNPRAFKREREESERERERERERPFSHVSSAGAPGPRPGRPAPGPRPRSRSGRPRSRSIGHVSRLCQGIRVTEQLKTAARTRCVARAHRRLHVATPQRDPHTRSPVSVCLHCTNSDRRHIRTYVDIYIHVNIYTYV